MKKLIILFTMLATTAYADGSTSLNLALPSPYNNFQNDRFRSGELDCQNAIGSATQLEFGVTGIINQGSAFSDNQAGDVGIYSRITIPLGKRPKSRIDCNRLYELELRKKQLEVLKLEQELNRLRELQFEN